MPAKRCLEVSRASARVSWTFDAGYSASSTAASPGAVVKVTVTAPGSTPLGTVQLRQDSKAIKVKATFVPGDTTNVSSKTSATKTIKLKR